MFMTGFPSYQPEPGAGLLHRFGFGYREWTTSRGKSLVRLKSFTGSRSIAKELCLSVDTISSYRTNILLKTRMKNNAEITHYAFQRKLVH